MELVRHLPGCGTWSRAGSEICYLICRDRSALELGLFSITGEVLPVYVCVSALAVHGRVLVFLQGSERQQPCVLILYFFGWVPPRPCLLWTKASWLQINQSKRDNLVFALWKDFTSAHRIRLTSNVGMHVDIA